VIAFAQQQLEKTCVGKSKKEKRLPDNNILVKNILSAFIWVPVPTLSQATTCPKCNSQVTAISNYCNFCGTALHQPIVLKICQKCSTRMDASANFCPECGQKQ